MDADYVGHEHVTEYMKDAQAIVAMLNNMGLDNAAIAANLRKRAFKARVDYNTMGCRLDLALSIALAKVADTLA